MALQDFAAGFSQTYGQAADRGVQNMQFQEKQELAERAQKAKERMQAKEIERLNQQIRQSGRMFPERLKQMRTENKVLDREAEMKTERATRLPDQLDQQERLREEKIDNAQSRGNQLDATAANMNQERRMREEQYQSQKARRQQRLDAPGPTPMPAPPSEGPSREVEENRNNFYRTTVTNSPIGMGMTAAGAALNALGFEDAGRGLAQAAYPEDDTGPASDRGRAYHQSELQSAQSVRERFNKDGAASPQAAQNVLRNLRRGMTALQKGVYNLDPEERRQMQRQYQREMEYFQRIAPRRDPAQGTAQQIVQGAMENESYGAAVNALEMLRERQQPQR